MDCVLALCWLAVAGLGHALQWGQEVSVGPELDRLGTFQGLLPPEGETDY